MKNISAVLIILLALLSFQSCYEKLTSEPNENQPPDTKLFLYPDTSISKQPSKLSVHWWGDDPDGVVIGFYFSWNGEDWTFTASNDSLFALQIGANDTVYAFSVAAVDNGGNGVYDNSIVRNGINFGPEPFIDANSNGKYDSGEFFYDIGLIDPTPASQIFPIKNSAPAIFWNKLTVLPDTSFPVMSFGWEASDIDGDATIQKINIALNDTSNPSNIISLNGAVRIITLRTKEFDTSSPQMEILLEGLETNIHSKKLPGLKLNDNNVLFVQAEDISGAKTKFISMPEKPKTWYVKKPRGKLLIIDDHRTIDNAPQFYESKFDSLASGALKGRYDVWDIHSQVPPFINTTFMQTLKLYNYVFWYTDNSPSLDLASVVVSKYIESGGKIAFSMQFPQIVDLTSIQSFLPILTDSSAAANSVFPGTMVLSSLPEYPNLETSVSIFRVRTFYLSLLSSTSIYYLGGGVLPGYIGFTDPAKKLFFIGLPLHKSNAGEGNVRKLLDKVFIQDFGMNP